MTCETVIHPKFLKAIVQTVRVCVCVCKTVKTRGIQTCSMETNLAQSIVCRNNMAEIEICPD